MRDPAEIEAALDALVDLLAEIAVAEEAELTPVEDPGVTSSFFCNELVKGFSKNLLSQAGIDDGSSISKKCLIAGAPQNDWHATHRSDAKTSVFKTEVSRGALR